MIEILEFLGTLFGIAISIAIVLLTVGLSLMALAKIAQWMF